MELYLKNKTVPTVHSPPHSKKRLNDEYKQITSFNDKFVYDKCIRYSKVLHIFLYLLYIYSGIYIMIYLIQVTMILNETNFNVSFRKNIKHMFLD